MVCCAFALKCYEMVFLQSISDKRLIFVASAFAIFYTVVSVRSLSMIAVS